MAGQHVDIRLTADNGYQAQRSYSIASPAGRAPRVELTVERVSGGEVSPFLTEELRAGDTIELRGPFGGYFTWDPGISSPLMLIAGGSGVVPLMSMLRTRCQAGNKVPAKLLYSSRSAEDIIYRDELDRLVANRDGFDLVHTLTRGAPTGWRGQTRRVDQRHARPSTVSSRQRSLRFLYVARPHSWRPWPINWSASGMVSRPSRPSVSVQRETSDDRRDRTARWKRGRRAAGSFLCL